MSQPKSNQGLSINDIFMLIHSPERFILTAENMSETYLLFKNLFDLFENKANL